MKMIPGTGTISNYGSYISNCQLNQWPYKVPVNSLADVQLYINIGEFSPDTVLYQLIHTCGALAGTIETITPANYVVAQDTNGNYYGVFKNFSGANPTCFVIAITLTFDGQSGDQIYFSEEYCIEACQTLTLLEGCYGNLDNKLSYDAEGVYFGTGEGAAVGDTTVVYKHKLLLRNVEVYRSAIKNTFKQGRTRNFRTEKEKIYQFNAEFVPDWYLDEIDAVFYRGEVFVGGVKYLVNETQFELIEECKKLWKIPATFRASYYQSFSCEANPCDPPATTCCDPVLISATVEAVPFDDGTMNKITVNFETCTPEPSGGYNVQWRVAGSLGAYTDAGNFFLNPAVFYDNDNPEGTEYEGLISSVVNDIVCDGIAWTTAESGVTPEYEIALQDPCDGTILSSYEITSGNPGDIVTVRASFGGVMQKIGHNFVRADLAISSPDGTSDSASSACYTDTSSHGFSITADTVITMTGTTAVIDLMAVVNNSSEVFTNVAVTIIDVNGDAKFISVVGCKGNSSTGGNC